MSDKKPMWYVSQSETARRLTSNPTVIRSTERLNASTDVVALMAAGADADATLMASAPYLAERNARMLALLRELVGPAVELAGWWDSDGDPNEGGAVEAAAEIQATSAKVDALLAEPWAKEQA